MINIPLFKRELNGSIKLLVIFAAIMALYIVMIISMYDPQLIKTLDEWVEMMPGLMSSVGMKAGATTLTGFISSYLYGFVLIVCPMAFCILRANGLVAKYADKGSMVTLLAAPVKRRVIAFTQMKVLACGTFILVLFAFVLEIICVASGFPNELEISKLILLNVGLLCLHLFVGGISFLASCMFSDTKYSIGIGAGIPSLMYIIQMLANTGGNAENFKYATFFTLYNPDNLIAGETSAIIGIITLFLCAVILFVCGIAVFSKRDLHV